MNREIKRLINFSIILAAIQFIVVPNVHAEITPINSVQETITGTGTTMRADLRAEFDQLGTGDRLRISVYIWTSGPMTESVIDALDRGVEVDIISETDRWEEHPSMRNNLIEMRNAGATVKLCYSGCRTNGGRYGLNHDKLVWIEKADGYDWATISSMNFTNQDLYESGLRFDLSHYSLIRQFVYERWTAHYCQATPIPATVNVGTDPDTDRLPDPGLRSHCPVFDLDYNSQYERQAGIFQSGGEKNHYVDWIALMDDDEEGNSPYNGDYCRLEIVMGHFDDSPQMMDVITELRKLRKRGCKVDVVYGGKRDTEAQLAIHQAIMDAATAPETAEEDNIEIEYQDNIHAKQLTFRGNWNGSSTQKFLSWAGSVNFTDNTMLWNDELGARSTNEAVYWRLREHFIQIEESQIELPGVRF